MEENSVENHILSNVDLDLLVVVMNGPIEGRYGVEINKSKNVFRFNIFNIAPHQQYVGTRTDFWVVNGDPSIAYHCYFAQALCPFPESKYTEEKVKSFKTINDILYTEEDYREYKDPDIEFPTTGYTFLLMMARIYSGDIYVYGFTGLKGGHYFNKNHHHASKHQGDLEYKDIINNYNNKIIIVR